MSKSIDLFFVLACLAAFGVVQFLNNQELTEFAARCDAKGGTTIEVFKVGIGQTVGCFEALYEIENEIPLEGNES